MADKVVAIHQPNFFPCLGYFDKIARADVFVVLDNVQFPKKGGTWTNRVRLLVNGEASWVTMPIVRAYHGLRLIREMEIDNTTPWRARVLKTIEVNYRRAPYFEDAFPFLEKLVTDPTPSLAEYNVAAIRALATALSLDAAKLVVGSTLDVDGSATDLLIATVKAVGGTAYLCGGGAAGYQDDEKFAAADVDLVYQDFVHPVYPQSGTREFVPGLSVIDALMNCSWKETAALVGGSSAAP